MEGAEQLKCKFCFMGYLRENSVSKSREPMIWKGTCNKVDNKEKSKTFSFNKLSCNDDKNVVLR